MSKKVLVVDDIPSMRMIFRDLLRQLGFTKIDEAEDGDQAWQMIQDSVLNKENTTTYELIVADWNMPGMTGVELLRAARGLSATQNIPFLLCTSNSGERHLTEAMTYGVTEYVVKPFALEQFRQKIELLLKKGHL
jgi:two-component system chemotaxis response regulator CheY